MWYISFYHLSTGRSHKYRKVQGGNLILLTLLTVDATEVSMLCSNHGAVPFVFKTTLQHKKFLRTMKTLKRIFLHLKMNHDRMFFRIIISTFCWHLLLTKFIHHVVSQIIWLFWRWYRTESFPFYTTGILSQKSQQECEPYPIQLGEVEKPLWYWTYSHINVFQECLNFTHSIQMVHFASSHISCLWWIIVQEWDRKKLHICKIIGDIWMRAHVWI